MNEGSNILYTRTLPVAKQTQKSTSPGSNVITIGFYGPYIKYRIKFDKPINILDAFIALCMYKKEEWFITWMYNDCLHIEDYHNQPGGKSVMIDELDVFNIALLEYYKNDMHLADMFEPGSINLPTLEDIKHLRANAAGLADFMSLLDASPKAPIFNGVMDVISSVAASSGATITNNFWVISDSWR